MKLDSRELGTVLAALRYWQEQGLADDPQYRSDELNDIATCHDAQVSMCGDEIDDLCERINCGTD
jgi:hypothetical protein